MANDQTQFLERLEFFDGQRLFASDLQDLERLHREMRELHNRSLHQAGIGNGFAVSGEAGDRQVTIGPGYAIDSAGHEIVHTTSRTEQVPPVEGEEDGSPTFYYLSVSYPPDEHLEESETRQGICQTRGVVRLREEPEFCWVRLVRDEAGTLQPRDPRLRQDIEQGRKLLLAQAEVQHCELQKLSVAQRRNARPPTRPYIFCFQHRDFVWTPISHGDGEFNVFRTVVNTTPAGFQSIPCYMARFAGPRERDLPVGDRMVRVFVDGLLSIEHPQRDRFTLNLIPIIVPIDQRVEALRRGLDDSDTVNRLYTEIAWLGIE
jgi:hypothetical protein